jgi:hypothetical protein
MSEDAQIPLYHGKYPQGSEGEKLARQALPEPSFLDNTNESIRKTSLTDDEVNSWLLYSGWNFWDFILQRASEGESGLIPRQEYETLSLLDMWYKFPKFVKIVNDAVGVDGLVQVMASTKREVGTKLNVLRNVALSAVPCIGRGIAIKLGHLGPDDERDRLELFIQNGRRMQNGMFGERIGFASGQGYTVKTLDDDILTMLVDQAKPLDDESRATFRRFNATTELFGFMLLMDNRCGLSDTGPYTLPDGRLVIVRDHFLNETGYLGSSVAEGLPFSVTEVLVFPQGAITATINDVSTTFPQPTNYLDYLQDTVVFARDEWNTPMSQLRVLDDAEMKAISAKCQKATMEMYKMVASKSSEEKIREGILVYQNEFFRPLARAAGVWEQCVAEGFNTLHPATEEAWAVLTGGSAPEILGEVLTGNGWPLVGQGSRD